MSAMSRRRFLTISAAVALARPGHAAEWRGTAMGAEMQITLHGPPALTEKALKAAQTRLRQIEAMFSLYDPASDLSRLNAAGVLHNPAPDFVALLRLSSHVHDLTGGLFDPTVQPLWLALAQGTDPAPARPLIGWHRVQITSTRITLAPGQALTLNGIGQGFAADAIRDTLRQHGLTRALVDMGEFAALGGPWRVGVADPAFGLVLDRPLNGNAIATSSPAAMALGAGGHILNPLAESSPQWSTVSVESHSAALADGLSTALCLTDRAGLETARQRAGPVLTRITALAANADIITVQT